ncbi:TonB-dependent receptor [Pseudomonadota bacterium]
MIRYGSPRLILLSILLIPATLSAAITITISPEWEEVDVQDMPMTVNVLSSEDLDARGISNTFDLQNAVPGFVFTTNTVLGQPRLRGVGSNLLSIGADASVATFYDGVYQPRSSSSVQNLYDIKRIEVSKGPQSVHLGRNVVAGAVSIVTNDPDPYFGASTDILLGSYNKREFRGMINQGDPASNMAFRLAGMAVKRDGYTENIFLNTDLNNEDYYSWRGKLSYDPSPDLNILFTVEQSREDSTRSLGFKLDPTIGVSGGVLAGGTVPSDPFEVNHNTKGWLDLEKDMFSLKATKDFGDAKLLAITGYQDYSVALAVELDGTEIDVLSNHPDESSKTFTQEVRYISAPKQGLAWVAGATLLKEEANQTFDVRAPTISFLSRPSGYIDTTGQSLFGQVSYQSSDSLKTTLGLRYNRDKRSMDYLQTVVLSGVTTTTKLDETVTWTSTTPEFGVEYTPSDETLVYGNVSRGFKAGGFNTNAAQPAFNPEYIWAYELGVKTFPLDSSLRFNAAVFYYDYSDMQVLALDPAGFSGNYPTVTNATEATIKGIDIEAWYWPREDVEFYLGMTLLEAEFDRYNSIDSNHPTDDLDRSGFKLPFAPDASVNAGLKHTWLFERGLLVSRLDYRYQSDVYSNPYEDDTVRQRGYGLVDAGVRFDSRKGHWNLELFVKNAADKLYSEAIYRADGLQGTLINWGAPRTFGLRFGYDF